MSADDICKIMICATVCIGGLLWARVLFRDEGR